MPLNDIFQLVVRCSAKGEKLVNVMHYQQTSSDGTEPTVEDVAKAWVADCLPLYRAAVSHDLTVIQLATHRVLPTVGGQYIEPVSLAGTIAEDMQPTQINAVLTLYSVNLERKGRGMIHVPAVPDSIVTNGRINNASTAPYVALGAQLCTAITGPGGATFQPGVLHKATGDFYFYVASQLRSNVRTLRGRRMTFG